MHAAIERLLTRRPVVTDGAWATQLQARGLRLGESAEAWNLTHPDRVAEVARAYVAAGSRIILTNTFAANRLALAKHGLGAQAAQINRRGVQISREAAAGCALVFASMGPSGRLLLLEETSKEELAEVFGEQAEALAAGGADGLVVETMTDADEAAIAVRAACRSGLPVVGCMVFDSGPQRDRTLMGMAPEEAVVVLAEAGADVVGSNCGQGIEGFVPLARRLCAATDRPVWIKANAGLPVLEAGRTVYRTTPQEFARHVPALADAGVSFVGGCCGTTPEFIEHVRAALDR